VSENHPRVILFDGICGLCNAWVDFILKRDPKGSFRFAPLQGEYASQVAPEQISELKSIVYICHGRKYTKSGAVLRILRDLGGIWQVCWVFWLIPFFIRDFFYSIVASNRYRIFGQKETCRIPSAGEKERFLS
jgi:predicted DCC family thiol-disulfide oxidoreductase YuxK